MAFIISKKLTKEEALKTMIGIENWFRKNPKRKICRTDIWVVRRGHLVEDVMKHTES